MIRGTPSRVIAMSVTPLIVAHARCTSNVGETNASWQS
jgi:hypothetical protein